jgi:hypothetical protein
MGRPGKIARLPLHLRSQLNQRLADGQPASTILPWLNENQEVQEVLADHFEGRPVSENNLSEWKQRGYVEWLRHQQAMDCARILLDEAEELENELDGFRLTDRVNEIAALALLQLLREAQAGEEGPGRRKAVLEIVRELQRLRRADHEMRRMQMEEEHWLAEQQAALKASIEERREETEWERTKGHIIGQRLWQEYRDGLAKGTLTPERAAQIRKIFEEGAHWRRECSIPDLPTEDTIHPPASRRRKSG